MRSFVISIIIMTVIISLSIANCYFTKSITDELYDGLEKIQNERSIDAFNEYSQIWEKYTFFFDTTIPKQKSENFIEGMAMIEAALVVNCEADLIHGITLSRAAIKSIAESNKVTIKNIL